MPSFRPSALKKLIVAASCFAFLACAHSADEPSSDDQPSTSAPEDAGQATNDSPASIRDAGAKDTNPPADTGTPPSDSGTGNDGTIAPQDSGPPPPPPDSGGGTGACDTSNSLKAAYYFYEFTQLTNPQLCPCGAGECCYQLFCVAQ